MTAETAPAPQMTRAEAHAFCRTVSCPPRARNGCAAPAGRDCRTPSGQRADLPHFARRERAMRRESLLTCFMHDQPQSLEFYEDHQLYRCPQRQCRTAVTPELLSAVLEDGAGVKA